MSDNNKKLTEAAEALAKAQEQLRELRVTILKLDIDLEDVEKVLRSAMTPPWEA